MGHLVLIRFTKKKDCTVTQWTQSQHENKLTVAFIKSYSSDVDILPC